jgi:hypothetical protein
VTSGASESAGPLSEVIDAIEDLGLTYHLGGSYASSVHGVPRQTLDADLVVDLDAGSVPRLAEKLRDRFYLDEERMAHAVARRSSFNLIHLGTGFKVDVFVKREGAFDDLELARSGVTGLPELAGRKVPVKSAEDTVLRKLQWFDEGGRTSDRQWSDVLGVIKAQGSRLDRDYLATWAGELGVGGLLEKALSEA